MLLLLDESSGSRLRRLLQVFVLCGRGSRGTLSVQQKGDPWKVWSSARGPPTKVLDGVSKLVTRPAKASTYQIPVKLSGIEQGPCEQQGESVGLRVPDACNPLSIACYMLRERSRSVLATMELCLLMLTAWRHMRAGAPDHQAACAACSGSSEGCRPPLHLSCSISFSK